MFKDFVRKLLLRLLIWTEKPKKLLGDKKVPVLSREIHLSPVIIIGVNIIFIFVALLMEFGPSIYKVLGLVIFVAIGFTLFISLLKLESAKLVEDNDAMMLLGLIIIFSVIGVEVIKSLHDISPFIMPVSGIVLLTAMLLNRNIALMVAVTVSFVCTILNDFRFEYIYFHIVGGIYATFIYARIKHRQDIVYASVKISIINFGSIIILTLFSCLNKAQFYNYLLWSVGNGVVSSGIVLLFLSPMEMFFSRLTDIKLLEMADFNQPLLKQLMLEAPGTYHHSLTVAAIAENCAGAIGANTLLVRVGAYYHDIGKLIKPEYFIENQIADENPHDSISPSMSGLIVLSHTKEGVNLAKKSNLDKPIVEIIEQHHGTSLLYSIYQKALERFTEQSETEFRYSGPKPKTKEAAILMLADACEAASRTIEPIPNRLKDMVEKIVNNKFTDGQLNDAPVTLSDLNKVAQRIVEALMGIYHARIEYETAEKKQNGTK